MDLNKLKTGKEFICYIFEEKKAYAHVCKWMGEEDGFYTQDGDGDFLIPVCEEGFFKHTKFIAE